MVGRIPEADAGGGAGKMATGARNVPARHLVRPRLFSELDAAVPNLTVISAPTGYGKSSLLRGWLAQRDPQRPLIELKLSEEPASLEEFWAKIQASQHWRAGTHDGAASDTLAVVIVIDGYEHLGEL